MIPGPVMPGPDSRGGPHAFVDDLHNPVLDLGDQHHLERSLRLRDGDPLTVSDGAGSWRACGFGTNLVPTGDIVFVHPPACSLTVGFALTKGSKPEFVVQKLTELGIDRIIPFVAEHSVVKWDHAKADKQHARLTRVTREAAMQSRRVRVPVLAPLDVFQRFVGTRAVRADRGGEPLAERHATVLIGPEGGWSRDERAALGDVNLSDHVLRAETAAIAAATLMTSLRSGY